MCLLHCIIHSYHIKFINHITCYAIIDSDACQFDEFGKGVVSMIDEGGINRYLLCRARYLCIYGTCVLSS